MTTCGDDRRVAVVTGAGRGIGRAGAPWPAGGPRPAGAPWPAGAPRHSGPEPAGPMAAFLARESCPAGAVGCPAGAGRFARMDATAADGYPRPDDGTPATGDAANLAAVDDEASCYVPKGLPGWSARYMSHLFGKEGSR